jgi:hypothetical protein
VSVLSIHDEPKQKLAQTLSHAGASHRDVLRLRAHVGARRRPLPVSQHMRFAADAIRARDTGTPLLIPPIALFAPGALTTRLGCAPLDF